MKHRFIHVLLLLLLSSSAGLLPAAAQTIILNATPTARPGEAVSLQGNFGAGAKVYAAAGGGGALLPVLTQGAGQVTVQLPGSLGVGVYQLWVQDGGQRSPSVYVNQAQGMHFDSPEVAPGGRLRLFGRNLRPTGSAPQVRFVGAGGGTAEVDAGQSDAYSLVLKAPASLQAGTTYQVMVSNGLSGSAETAVEQPVTGIRAGADYFGLNVGWAAKLDFYGNVYNVRTDGRLARKATGNGSTDDQQAIQAAIDRAAADGGGVVYLPAGTYKMQQGGGASLFMRSRVVVRGAGKDQTILKFGYGNVSPDRWGLIWDNPRQAGLADLTLINVNDSGQWMQNMTGQGTELFMQRVRFDLNRGDWLWWATSDKLVIANSDFTQGVDDRAGYHGPIQLNGCRNFVVNNNSFTYAVDGLNLNKVHEGVFENNRVYRDGAARYPSSLVNHVLILNFAENIAVLNNQFKVINGKPQDKNDGETIIAEGGGSGAGRLEEDAGTVSAAWGNTLQDNGKGWSAVRNKPVVAIVSGRGMGQWRTITSRGGNTLTLDRAWDVVPEAGSHYALFNWGARNWLLQGNTMEGNRRGITLYQNATLNVAAVGNTLTNSGSIDFMAWQGSAGYQQFLPIYNCQITGNNVADTNGQNGAFIGTHTTQAQQAKTFGTSVVNLDVRGNTLTAHSPNVPAVVDDVFPEGYLNYLAFQQGSGAYIDEQVPAILGSIFQNNTAINCDNALYVNSGAYNTLVCNTTLINSPNLLDDNRIPYVGHTSTGTAACLGATAMSLRTPENPPGTAVGLNYAYYEGYWKTLPEPKKLDPAVKTGISTAFDLSQRRRDYGYLLEYSGYINVPADGIYTFFTDSDDGSRLYIGSQLVVDNDGLHEEQESSGTIGLKAGVHAISVAYMQGAASQTLAVAYLGPGIAKQDIPSAVLLRATAAPATAGLRTPENPASTTGGLDYGYYEGNWNTLPDFSQLRPVKSGTATTPDLGQRQRDNSYAVRYSGYVTVPADGQYTFYTGSDDGSRLYIGSELVVDNDGLHAYEEQSGQIGLKAGTHAVTITFLQGGGDQTLDLRYAGPNLGKQPIPAGAWRRTTTQAAALPVAGLRVPENPAGTAAGLDYGYYEGFWNTLPNFGGLNPVRTGAAAAPDLSQRQREYGYAVRYSGYVTVPADGQYTFYTGSDDGSRLYIGSELVVDNDGLHAYEEQSGQIGLQAGTHAVTITFLQGGGDQTMDLRYAGPGLNKQPIPASAWRRGGNSGKVAGLRVPENPAGATAGLNYAYYEGFWNTLPNFGGLNPVRTGAAAAPDLSQRQREYGYAVRYSGYVTVPTDGQYTFYTGSDDGSRLYIGSELVVDNDGLHAYEEQSGQIGLQAGTHAVTITFLQGGGDQTLDLRYEGPGLGKQLIPRNSLRRTSGLSASAASADVTTTGDGGSGLGAKLSVFPNPTAGAFTVAYSSPKAQVTTLTLTDGLGRQVLRQVVQAQVGDNQVPVQTPDLAPGVYQLLLLGADGQRQTQRVVISR